MDNKKDNNYYLAKIITDLEFITKNFGHLSQQQLKESEVFIDSAMFRLIQISENSNNLSDDFKAQYPSIPWRAIKGMRNRIVHEYGEVDLSIVYDTIKNDIPVLLDALKNTLM